MSSRANDSARPLIERCLDEFDELWDRGRRPRAIEFRDRFSDSDRADFVELIYQEFCRSEADGLKPDHAEFINAYPEFRAALERLFAVHIGLESDIETNKLTMDSASKPRMPNVGDRIGPYHLQKILGQGGLGRVFLAYQTDLSNRPVVVKVVRACSTPEAENQASVTHANIMPVYRHFLTDDGVFLIVVMPYLPGVSVDQLVRDRPAGTNEPQTMRRGDSRRNADLRPRLFELSDDSALVGAQSSDRCQRSRQSPAMTWDRQVADWGAQLAMALSVAYKRGIIHGDVKPGNVFISRDLVPFLLDFHLSRRWRFERHLAVIDHEDPGGTLPYMPPERLDALADRIELSKVSPAGSRSDQARFAHRGDLYGLALVLLELLTGHGPETTEVLERSELSTAARAMAVGRRKQDWLRKWPGFDRLSKPWRVFLTKALEAEPSARHADGIAFADELQLILTSRTSAERIGRVARSRKMIAGAVMSLAAATAVLAWFAIEAHRRAETISRLFWQVPYELWDDPAAAEDRNLAARLRSSRAEFERLVSLNDGGHAFDEASLAIVSGRHRLDADLWFADRVEILSKTMSERAVRFTNMQDAVSALKILELGLNRWEVGRWRNRERDLLARFGQQVSRDGASGSVHSIVSDYVESIGAESAEDASRISHSWESLLRREPRSFALRWGYARHLTEAGLDLAAIRELEIALENFPDHFEARRLLAHLQFRNRDFESALNNIEIALKSRHDDLSSLRIRAILLVYVGHREQLQREIERMGEIFSISDDPKGEFALNEGNADVENVSLKTDSREVLNTSTVEKMRELFPNDPDVKTLLVKKYYREKRFGEAIALMEELMARRSRRTQDMINLAILYRNDFRKEKAVDLCVEIIRSDDFGYWLNYSKVVKAICLSAVQEIGRTDFEIALGLCRTVLSQFQENQNGKGVWHVQIARLILMKDKEAGLDDAIEHLILAGQQHQSYLTRWYAEDQVFDAFRDRIDPIVSDHFPMLANTSNPLSKRRGQTPSP